MVQIYIKTNKDRSMIEEWIIIELQGDLECENGESLSNKFMADLHYNKEGTPILILGPHVMYGKMCNLEKPMVLLRKNVTKLQNPESMIDEEMTDESAYENILNKQSIDEEIKYNTEYVVYAVIKKKILFNKRPRPIIFNEYKK